jgi:hypothetical protein
MVAPTLSKKHRATVKLAMLNGLKALDLLELAELNTECPVQREALRLALAAMLEGYEKARDMVDVALNCDAVLQNMKIEAMGGHQE